MSKIDWTKPIELEDGTPLNLVCGPDADGHYEVVRRDNGNFRHNGLRYTYVDDLGIHIDGGKAIIRNVREPEPETQTEPETLHINPAPDNFVTESPIRAFTHWDAQGKYAIGKGFRPSLQHLARYLDAMISKEGWELVQILESATSAPSFVFRKN